MLSRISVVLFIGITVAITTTVSGSCNFPSAYQNRFWFRIFSYNSATMWMYRLLRPDVIVDNQNDNSSVFASSSPCQDLYLVNQSVLYYLTSDNYCAKAVITDDATAILIQEVDARTNILANAAQCVPLLNETCLAADRCSAIWMPIVYQLTSPPQFNGSIQCPFQGVYQLSADYGTSSSICLGDPQSTAVVSGSNIQFNACNQNNLQSTSFKQSRILGSDNITCMAQLPGDAVNSDESGSKILLIRDQTSLFCARYTVDSVGNILLAINIKNSTSASCGSGSFNASSGSNIILLKLGQIPSIIPGIITTIPTTIPTTSTSSLRPTPTIIVGLSPTGTLPTTPLPTSSTTSTSTSTTTSTATSSTTSTTTTPVATSSTTGVGISSSTTTSTSVTSTSISSTTFTTSSTTAGILIDTPTNGPTPSTASTSIDGTPSAPPSTIGPGGSGAPPSQLNDSTSDNCDKTNPCGQGAYCSQPSQICRCQSVFYRYNRNASRCVQDDGSIDDAFLKIVVPIIAVAAAGSIIAGLVLCITANPLNASVTADAGATLAAASRAVTQPAQVVEPAYISYGRNLETYANIESIDKSLVTYGNQAPVHPANNYFMVGSSIPLKM